MRGVVDDNQKRFTHEPDWTFMLRDITQRARAALPRPMTCRPAPPPHPAQQLIHMQPPQAVHEPSATEPARCSADATGYELILCRDALQHLPLLSVVDALENFARSDARFLLVRPPACRRRGASGLGFR